MPSLARTAGSTVIVGNAERSRWVGGAEIRSVHCITVGSTCSSKLPDSSLSALVVATEGNDATRRVDRTDFEASLPHPHVIDDAAREDEVLIAGEELDIEALRGIELEHRAAGRKLGDIGAPRPNLDIVGDARDELRRVVVLATQGLFPGERSDAHRRNRDRGERWPKHGNSRRKHDIRFDRRASIECAHTADDRHGHAKLNIDQRITAARGEGPHGRHEHRTTFVDAGWQRELERERVRARRISNTKPELGVAPTGPTIRRQSTRVRWAHVGCVER